MVTELRDQNINHRSRRRDQIIASAQIGMSHAQNHKKASARSPTAVVIKVMLAELEARMAKRIPKSRETTLSADLVTTSRQHHISIFVA